MKSSRKKEKPYLERDISWMYFNRRILQEATRTNVPLLERLAFLGIYSNNLDEFFRVRIATQNRIVECTDRSANTEKEKAKRILRQIGKLNAKYIKDYEATIDQVTSDLKKENIYIISDSDVTPEQMEFIRNYYKKNINGFITPIWFSAIKSLDNENDENIYLAVKLSKDSGRVQSEYAFLELPVNLCGRFIRLPDNNGKKYLMYLDDVIRCCLPLVFEGLEYIQYEAYAFKFTRDAEMEIDNDLRAGMLQKISKGVKSRKNGEPLRVIYDSNMPKDLLRKVLKKLHLDAQDTVIESGRYHNHKDLMRFPDCGRKDLRYPEWTPILRKELDGPESLLKKIQERLAKDSKVVKSLIGAARNGKKVTVVIELLARFDEASNINWSKRMQDAGIKVIFGVEGLKVHSKITHIGMKSGKNIACISTGNFHEGNAKTYTDCMLMTAHAKLVKDVEQVFNFIERPYSPIRFKNLLVSPNEMKNKFITLINNEIKNKKTGKTAYIKIKINHITDPDIVNKLYEAASAGVTINHRHH